MPKPRVPFKGLLSLLIILTFTNIAHSAKIGFFAGTFDPPHPTHELIVQQAIARLNLDEVIIFVNKTPKNKPNASPYFHRYAMANLVFSKLPKVRMMTKVEADGFGHQDIEYYDHIAFKNPNDKIYALAGSDLFPPDSEYIYNFFEASNIRQVVFLREDDDYRPATDDVLIFDFPPGKSESSFRSSTAIRSQPGLLHRHSPQFRDVFEYALEHQLYSHKIQKCEGRFFL